jgi:hypothetical protein
MKIAALCVLVLALPFIGIWNAYVVTKLWTWFIVAHFGAKAMTMPVAYGACLLVWLATYKPSGDKEASASTLAFAGIVGPAIALLCGWIAQGFM